MADFLDFFNTFVMGSVQMLLGFYCFNRFLKKNAKWTDYALFAAAGTVLLFAVPNGGAADFLTYVLLLAAYGILKQKADYATILLYAAVTAEIMRLCFGILNSALSVLYPLMFASYPQEAGYAFMVLGYMALPAAFFCCRVMERHFLNHEAANSRYALLMLMPAIIVFLMGEYIGSGVYGNIATTGGGAANIRHGRMFAAQILGMASLFSIMFAYQKLSDNFRLSAELSLLEQEEQQLCRYVEEADMRYQKTKSFRHDIKNHVMVARELLQNGKPEQALHYLGDMEGMAGELSFPCSTNHPAADILIANKFGLAKSHGIDAQCFLKLPSCCRVRDIDFCIILSNALDNAVCACKSMEGDAEKYIRLTSRMQGDFILLEIENSFQGNGAFQEGTGLSNIRAVAGKYDGAVSVKALDSVFVLSVLLVI